MLLLTFYCISCNLHTLLGSLKWGNGFLFPRIGVMGGLQKLKYSGDQNVCLNNYKTGYSGDGWDIY
jgi:hypothetical protein